MNHIRNVLRMKPGEEIAVSNGQDGREYRCGIERIGEDEILCTLRFIKEDGLELPSRITLFQCLPKADKMELVIQKAVELGAGEILLTSMDADGTKAGFDLEMTKAVTEAVTIPVIASGGCGSLEHFAQVFEATNCDAALAASLFHFGELTVPQVKEYLAEQGIPVR